LAYIVDLDPGIPVKVSAAWGSRSGRRNLPVMKYLSPRTIPAMSRHRTGQAVVRFAVHEEGDPKDLYLGVYGSAGAKERYEKEVWDWTQWLLEVGWAPAEWKPAETGHSRVLTVGELVEGYRWHLAELWGEGWQRVRIDEDQVRAYREALDRGREQMKRGRRIDGSVWDRQGFREGKQLVDEARRRYGHLDEGLKKQWTEEVLDELLGDFGPVAAAVLGDRELRRLRGKLASRDLSFIDRKTGMGVVREAYCYVIGRKPCAPWNKDRSHLKQKANEYGVDLGIVGADGRWVRTG
jgi:hypothetical protein